VLITQGLRPRSSGSLQSILEAYQVLPDEELLEAWSVRLTLDLKALISRNGVRAECEVCGEEIINEREVVRDGHVCCRSCAEEAYYQLVGAARESA
jgi:formylmethanofuran dehydrogenase subunit E